MISATLLALLSVNEAILVQAKNSNGTTMRMFSNFNVLRGRCTLLPFPSLLRHYALLFGIIAFHSIGSNGRVSGRQLQHLIKSSLGQESNLYIPNRYIPLLSSRQNSGPAIPAHPHPSRRHHHSFPLFTPFARTTAHQSSFFISCTRIWNSLPDHIICA